MGFHPFQKSCGFWDRSKRRLDLELPRFVAMAFYWWFIVVLWCCVLLLFPSPPFIKKKSLITFESDDPLSHGLVVSCPVSLAKPTHHFLEMMVLFHGFRKLIWLFGLVLSQRGIWLLSSLWAFIWRLPWINCVPGGTFNGHSTFG